MKMNLIIDCKRRKS